MVAHALHRHSPRAKSPFMIAAPMDASTLERQAGIARHVMGVLLPGDVGKRVYRSGRVYQVENDSQRDARLGEKP